MHELGGGFKQTHKILQTLRGNGVFKRSNVHNSGQGAGSVHDSIFESRTASMPDINDMSKFSPKDRDTLLFEVF